MTKKMDSRPFGFAQGKFFFTGMTEKKPPNKIRGLNIENSTWAKSLPYKKKWWASCFA